MMKEYEVSVPVMGIARLTIVANSPDEALAEAIDTAGPDAVDEWWAMRQVVEGNVYHGPLNRAQIDSVFVIEDDE